MLVGFYMHILTSFSNTYGKQFRFASTFDKKVKKCAKNFVQIQSIGLENVER